MAAKSLPLLALALVFPLLHPAAAEDAADWIVAQDTVLEGGVKAVPGDVVVQPNATLTLRGATVLVGGQVVVERGARLVLGPHASLPATLGPLTDEGFSMRVDGRFETSGMPRSIVEGLNGGALAAATSQGPGGITVNGTAVLHDLWVRNGTAGLVVREGAELDLVDSRLENLYLMGIAALGHGRLERVETAGNIIAFSGKGAACSITVRDSVLDTISAVAQMNGCPLTIERSRLLNGGTSLILTNPGEHVVRDSVFEGYKTQGIRGDGSNRIVLSNVTFHPHAAATRAMELRPGTHAVLDGVTIDGHAGDGILAQASTLELRDASIQGNAGFGVSSVNGDFPGGLDGAQLSGNTGGAFRDVMHVRFTVVSEEGVPVAGYRLKVMDNAGATLLDTLAPDANELTVEFPTFTNGTAGPPQYRGPFQYEVLAAAGEARGAVAPVRGAIVVPLAPAADANPAVATSAFQAAPLLAVLALAMLAARRGRAA